MEKIFFIGFNKCGTTAIHYFLLSHGIRSVHWRSRRGNIAQEIEARLNSDMRLKHYLARWTAYSDLTAISDGRFIEGNRHFRSFHRLFPNAYFVLNDRDVDDWIASRVKHRKGEMLGRAMTVHGLKQEAMLDLWREQYHQHFEAVQAHFRGHPRFLHFRIDRDPVETLVKFLAPSFTLEPRLWRVVNRTKERPRDP